MPPGCGAFGTACFAHDNSTRGEPYYAGVLEAHDSGIPAALPASGTATHPCACLRDHQRRQQPRLVHAVRLVQAVKALPELCRITSGIGHILISGY